MSIKEKSEVEKRNKNEFFFARKTGFRDWGNHYWESTYDQKERREKKKEHHSKIFKLQPAWENAKQIQEAEIMGGSNLYKQRHNWHIFVDAPHIFVDLVKSSSIFHRFWKADQCENYGIDSTWKFLRGFDF